MRSLVTLLVLAIPLLAAEKPVPELDKLRLLSLFEKVTILQYQQAQLNQRISLAIKEYNELNQKVLKDYPEGSTLTIDIDKQDVVVTPKQEKK